MGDFMSGMNTDAAASCIMKLLGCSTVSVKSKASQLFSQAMALTSCLWWCFALQIVCSSSSDLHDIKISALQACSASISSLSTAHHELE